jgi:hypothetical protein
MCNCAFTGHAINGSMLGQAGWCACWHTCSMAHVFAASVAELPCCAA